MKRYFTGAGLILSDDNTKVLLILHKKFDLWLPPGGLREDDEFAHEAALREVKEEVGFKVEIVCTSLSTSLFYWLCYPSASTTSF